MSDSRFAEALAYFRSVGYSQAQSAGIVGNLWGESKLNTEAVGDGGRAIGIAQWHPDRQANFKAQFGKDIRNATFGEQLKFVAWELSNTESSAGKALKSTTNIQDATKVFMQKYERPANMSSYNERLKAAGKAYDIGYSGSAGSPTAQLKAMMEKLPDFLKYNIPGIGAGIAGADIADATGVKDEAISAFEEFVNWIPRAVAIILGVALVIIALIVLMGDKVNIEQIIPAVKQKRFIYGRC